MSGKISSIILNWNRLPLLKRTISSYLATAPEDRQLFVVDNGSTDGSREYLEELRSTSVQFELVTLAHNVGGRAVNSLLERCSGDLIQFIENDQEFLPGWYDYVEKSFQNFPNLGQLSLFAPVPTDDEAWETKPSHLRFAVDDFLYEAHGNCGFSSVLRATIFRDCGVQISNVSEETEFLLPDDAKLSREVKENGFFCAHSKQYFTSNLGHFVEEFENDEDYYIKNYRSKPWLGEEGWRARIAANKSTLRPIRATHLFPSESVLPEKSTVGVAGKSPSAWSMLDGFTAEVEVLEFLFGLVRMVKPSYVLETGTWRGYSACAMGKAMLQNGFGKLDSLEFNAEIALVAQSAVNAYQLESIVSVVNMASLEFEPKQPIDFALLDSDIGIRHLEFRHFRHHFAQSAFVAFHDVAPHHGALNDNVRALVNEGLITGIDFPTPRGLFLGKVCGRSGPTGSRC